jgi:nucleotide-binding universal stress UspA family protein
MLTIHRILCPTDFSDPAHTAFDVACALARDYDADLIVCHVTPPSVAAVAEGVMLELPEDTTGADAARLERLSPDDPAVRIARRMRQGDAAAEILKLAADEEADLIVMGTHGRGGLARLVLGSVAESVMRRAPCPVLTLKSSTRTRAAAEPAVAGA